jgi:dTDP-4-dehydrorhamnose 3,5-epimerase
MLMSLIEGVIIKKLEKFQDERGWLSEIWRSDELDFNPLMAYCSLTKPGVSRGPHEHKLQSDAFVFFGPGDFELYLWENRKGKPNYREKEKIIAGESNPVFVLVPPGVVHGYKCVSDCPAYSVNFPDKLYKGKNKNEEIDEIRWEEDSELTFKI